MDQFLADAKRLKHRLHNHDNSVDMLINEATNLQNKLIAMRQYRDEVNKMNEDACHRPRSTLILGSQLENQRIQNLEQENRELSISLAEHQSAIELIMNKYREQVLSMMNSNESGNAMLNIVAPLTENEVIMQERIIEMAHVMQKSTVLDDRRAVKEISLFRQMQIENENLRELLKISGQKSPSSSYKNQLDEFYKGYDINVKEDPNNEILYKQEMMHNKDSGIYDTEFSDSPLNGNNSDGLKTNKSKPNFYNSLENLFSHTSDENDGTQNKVKLDDLTVEDEPSENCFRAIITDIKPFVEIHDDAIYSGERDITHNINNSNEQEDLSLNVTNSSERDENSINKSNKPDINNEKNSSQGGIKSNDINNSNEGETNDDICDSIKKAVKDAERNNDSENDLVDSISTASVIHLSLNTHKEVKMHLKTDPENTATCINKVSNQDENEFEALNMLDDVLKFDMETECIDDLDDTVNDKDVLNAKSIDPPDYHLSKDILTNGYTDYDKISENPILSNNIKTDTINNDSMKSMNGSTSYSESDCESDITIVSDSEINDVMSCFDSILDENLDN